ncbi:TPA: carbohydrate porin [Klebsiella pneumoniae]|nr:carbohydrate porin [Klebsiella pneumoniae subsp. pneumoniae]HBX5131577.1 carbohydrate porin [Klebsiella pneumoniae]HBY2535139.1 carbohydrate porin [Klebsiella pneumoniae]
MRISVISAAVCCALFPLISVSAAGLSVEQRLAQLEARRGGGAAGAGAQPADHGSRTKTAGH